MVGLFRFLTVLCALYSFCYTVGAVRAGFETDNVEVFVPTSAWLVGSASLLPVDDIGFSMPCVMMNQYNNGHVIRFSGGKERIMAMAVDFRQDSFKPGRSYDVEIEIPSHFKEKLSAMAHNGGAVLVDVTSHAGLYKALQAGKYMYLMIDGQKFNFALLGVRDGLQRVEHCYNPKKSAPRHAALPAGFQKTINRHKADKPKEEPVAPAYSQALQKDSTPSMPDVSVKTEDKALTPMLDAPSPKAEIESTLQEMSALNTMLQSAAQKLANLKPAAGSMKASHPALNETVAVKTKPIGKALANTWASPLESQRKQGLKQRDIVVAGHASAASRERNWRAMRGNNLHEILDVWAHNENVRLIWSAAHEFSVQKSISIQGTFEEAVLAVLDQYDGGKMPAGRIYIDPVLNQRVLLIEMQTTIK